jgi:hypothetical protein
MKLNSLVLSLTILLLPEFSCKPKSKDKKSKEANIKSARAKNIKLITKPTTYCEKSFVCSYQMLETKQAKKTYLLKQKAFILSCEDSMRHFPKKIVKEYEKCVSVKCGSELKKCIFEAGKKGAKPVKSKIKKVDLLKKNIPAIKNTKDSTDMKPVVSPEVKPTSKPEVKPATKPVVKPTVKPVVKTGGKIKNEK